MTTETIHDDPAVQAARAEHNAAHEAHAALLARRAPLAARLSFQFNSSYPCPPELAAMPFLEAAREADVLDRELVASQKRVDVANSALYVAEIIAAERLRASVAPPPVIADERKG